ncbi:MAG: HAMP domain-containing histidine kinase, partial [Cyclobacteriaceae bacterium]|nr:HAMP domain-containing histidine kinase [Cyclobacteriaceae bacterium]
MIFNLSKVIRENIHLLSKASKNKNIQIEILFDENILVFADINSVKTIIRNLVSNAIKFSHPEGAISISVDEWLDFVEVGVRDTGVGMSEEDQQKIFDISAKHSTLGTNKEKGTGLGLILCKEFAERNRGSNKVESEIGVGTTFKFTLPKSNESEIVQLEEAQ